MRWEDVATGVKVGGNRTLKSPGRGDVKVIIAGRRRMITDVLFVPKLGYNLLSISALEQKGYAVSFSKGEVTITKNGTSTAVGYKAKNLYHLSNIYSDTALVTDDIENSEIAKNRTPPTTERLAPEGENNEVVSIEDVDRVNEVDGSENAVEWQPQDAVEKFKLLHQRFGHPGKGRTEAIHRHALGIHALKTPADFFCDVCESNKLTRRIRKYRYNKEILPGGRLFCDVWGPYMVRVVIPGINADKYYCSIVDEATARAWIQTGWSRAMVAPHLIGTINTIERDERKVVVRHLRMDNAKEYKSVEKPLSLKGIVCEYSTNYTPEQNGTAERFNRSIITTVRCLLQHADLPDGFWPEAARYACHLRNVLPLSDGDSPFERWFKYKPLLEAERTWGMLCKVHVPKEKRHDGKLESPIALDGIYMGVHSETQHRVYVPYEDYRSVGIYTNVKIFENRKATHLLQRLVTTSSVIGSSNAAMALTDQSNEHYPGEFEAQRLEITTDVHNINPRPQQDAVMQLPLEQNLSFTPNFGGEKRPDSSTPGVEAATQRENLTEGVATPMTSKDVQRALDQVLPNSPKLVANESTAPTLDKQIYGRDQAPPEFAEEVDETLHRMDIDDVLRDAGVDNDVEVVVEGEPEPMDLDIPRTRRHQPYNRYEFDNRFGTAFLATADADPVSYRQAVNSGDSFRWKEAIQKELTSHATNGTWEVVNKPKGRKTITSKWVFKKKFLPSGLIDKYKARLVARGFTQQHGIDYEETFAPTLRYESLRLLFALAVKHRLRLWLLDVITAYLNGDIDAEIFMEIPEGMPQKQSGKVLKLLKGLYGLKQSGRIWNEKFRKVIKKIGFQPITADTCIFKKEFDQGTCLIALYVDDIIIASNRSSIYRSVKEAITSVFKVTDSGPLTGVLGIRVTQDLNAGMLAMDQANYIESMLAKHQMTNCNPSAHHLTDIMVFYQLPTTKKEQIKRTTNSW